MTTTTVLALFRDPADAEAAVRALRSADFDSARLGIARAGESRVPKFGYNAVFGILAGTIGCGIIGVLVGTAVTGFMPGAFAGGWFAPLMIGIGGAVTGAVAGGLISLSMSRQHALYYEDEVAAGRTLVSVHADAGRIEDARRILLEEGAFEAAPIDTPLRKAS